jgi:hypothetical protein
MAIEHNRASLKGLTQCFQDLPSEFGQFIQKKHPTVSQGNFTGHGPGAAAYHGRKGYGWMRLPKRTMQGGACSV